MITQTINLNLIPGSPQPRINVSQYDNGSRTLQFNLYNGVSPYEIPSGASVYIVGTKADNTGFEYACTFDGSLVSVDITDQMTVFAGEVQSELRIVQSDEILGTANFIINVESAALSDDTQFSETDIPIIQRIPEILGEAEGYADTAHKWATFGADTETPSSTNNAKYWAEQSQVYAAGALHWKSSVAFANIPTSGMTVGDFYNITDDFTTDSRFDEGAGIKCAAGTNIVWDTNNKWDILTPSTVASQVKYDNTTSGLSATNVQGAIDEALSENETAISSAAAWMVYENNKSPIRKYFVVSTNSADKWTYRGRGTTGRGNADKVVVFVRAGGTFSQYGFLICAIGTTAEAVTWANPTLWGSAQVSSFKTKRGNILYFAKNEGTFQGDSNMTLYGSATIDGSTYKLIPVASTHNPYSEDAIARIAEDILVYNMAYTHLTQNTGEYAIANDEPTTTSSQAYSVGQYLTQGGNLKKVTNAIASGESITSNNTRNTTVGDELRQLNSDLTGNDVQVVFGSSTLTNKIAFCRRIGKIIYYSIRFTTGNTTYPVSTPFALLNHPSSDLPVDQTETTLIQYGFLLYGTSSSVSLAKTIPDDNRIGIYSGVTLQANETVYAVGFIMLK